jgi:hypothetical protein
MKPALYVLGGSVVALGAVDFGMLLAWGMTALFGLWGLVIEVLLLFALAGGWAGWLVYRERSRRAAVCGMEPKR